MNQYNISNNPTITALHSLFTITYPENFKFHGETHNFYEILIILSGSATVAADNRVFTLSAGQAVLHPPMQFHNVSSNGSGKLTVAVISFSGKNIPEVFNRVCVIEDMSLVYSLLKKADKYFLKSGIWVVGKSNHDNSHFRFIKVFELFLLTLGENTLNKNKKPSVCESNYSNIVRTLEQHIFESLTVNDIASLCNMSVIGLQKTFSRFAGIGVMEYFNGIKMRKAIEFLKNGQSVKETALMFSFSDPNYFSTVFKRLTGHSPSHFKK